MFIEFFESHLRLIVDPGRQTLGHAKKLIALSVAGIERLKKLDLLGGGKLGKGNLTIEEFQAVQEALLFRFRSSAQDQVHISVNQAAFARGVSVAGMIWSISAITVSFCCAVNRVGRQVAASSIGMAAASAALVLMASRRFISIGHSTTGYVMRQ